MSFTPATESLIRALQALPGIGSRSAARMALHLLERDTEAGQHLQKALSLALERVHRCPSCRSLTELALCEICADDQRDSQQLCVVANDSDRAAIELSGKYTGQYFVLHGVLSPIDGVGPEELGVSDLLEKVTSKTYQEVLIALDDQMEAEATAHYLSEKLKAVAMSCSRVTFHNMKSGALDKADSRSIGHALANKQEIGFEQD